MQEKSLRFCKNCPDKSSSLTRVIGCHRVPFLGREWAELAVQVVEVIGTKGFQLTVTKEDESSSPIGSV